MVLADSSIIMCLDFFRNNPEQFIEFRTYDEKYILKEETVKQLEEHMNAIISYAKKNYASYFNTSKDSVTLSSIKNSPVSIEEWARKDFKQIADTKYSLRIPSYYLDNIR